MIVSGDALEPLEPAPLPTILPYSDCGVPAIEAQYFPDHVAKLHANSEAGFCQEFDEIEKSQINSWPDSVARLPENGQKNRYTNIFPCKPFGIFVHSHARMRFIEAIFPL